MSGARVHDSVYTQTALQSLINMLAIYRLIMYLYLT